MLSPCLTAMSSPRPIRWMPLPVLECQWTKQCATCRSATPFGASLTRCVVAAVGAVAEGTNKFKQSRLVLCGGRGSNPKATPCQSVSPVVQDLFSTRTSWRTRGRSSTPSNAPWTMAGRALSRTPCLCDPVLHPKSQASTRWPSSNLGGIVLWIGVSGGTESPTWLSCRWAWRFITDSADLDRADRSAHPRAPAFDESGVHHSDRMGQGEIRPHDPATYR